MYFPKFPNKIYFPTNKECHTKFPNKIYFPTNKECHTILVCRIHSF